MLRRTNSVMARLEAVQAGVGLIEALVGLWRAEMREIAIFLLIILVLVFRPAGLFGTKSVEKI